MELNEILSKAVHVGASDIHLKHGVMPVFRVHGRLVPMDKQAPRLTGEQIERMSRSIMSPTHQNKFNETHEVDMGYGVPGLGRFRINIFQQRGSVGMVIRSIPFQIRTIEDLELPPVIKKITAYERGLVLVTGMTGSGKSTTLASMLDFINSHRNCHILTIEDPIEYLIKDRKSIINQRELGLDTPNFSLALRQSLRQDPDIIFVGEMRDVETIRTALLAAETGHLVFSTLHTTDATETVNRIVSVFDPHEQMQIRYQLAANLKAVISQRLVPKAEKKGQIPAVEVMIVNARIKDMIVTPAKTREIPLAIQDGVHTLESQTFDQSLLSLLYRKLISFDEAKATSTNPEEFELQWRGVQTMEGKKWDKFDKTSIPIPTIPGVELQTMPRIKGENTPPDEDPDDDN
ncbi:MAG: type IV pilus twitching motility protein PilT [Oligoflexia bacterium]|nr:type IV pilus twitching motility protein PilT [Oligoflexia bacterium]